MRAGLGALILGAAGGAPGAATAEEEEAPALISLGVSYIADGIATVSGGASSRAHYLDNVDFEASLDLGEAFGWRGGVFHVHGLSNSGGAPNDDAQTLEGISNIEVADQGLRLFELYLSQKLGPRITLGLGFQDMNRDFYANDSAGLLIAPPFGIGSEIASTGPNGPSIFPSSALGASVRRESDCGWFAQAAVMDATAGVVGDPGGIHVNFENGALFIGEAGITRGGKLAFGGWGYSQRQDDIRAADASGAPLQRAAFGFYALAEKSLRKPEKRAQVTGFSRIGVAGSESTDFRGGFQAGVLAQGFWRFAPDAQASFGFRYAALNASARANAREGGADPANELGLEITYAHPITRHIAVQPDVQVVAHPGGARDRPAALVLGLRISASFSKDIRRR